jgi:hypothetical protein
MTRRLFATVGETINFLDYGRTLAERTQDILWVVRTVPKRTG